MALRTTTRNAGSASVLHPLFSREAAVRPWSGALSSSVQPAARFFSCPACAAARTLPRASSRPAARAGMQRVPAQASASLSLLALSSRIRPRASEGAEEQQRRHQSSSSSSSSSASPRASSAQARADAAKAQFYRQRNQSLLLYSLAGIVFVLGTTYAAVPLYRVFCSATGFGGTPITSQGAGGDGDGRFDPSRLVPATHDPNTSAPTRRIRVTFNADTSDALPWSFTPVQKEIYVLPGETALAFFTAKNHGPKDIIGIATYNVAPDRIAPFFAKVECFCFEEQRLLAGEEVDMPVFFFLDVDMLDEPSVREVRDVVLSYTFFSARRNKVNGQLEPDTDLEQYRVGKD
ncbi:Cytochrome c oxidase assembly protein cox11, mitochondrial [Tilletia horrida]|nr:Cytochrome c oxidase assembly protein cox11, mitochondrial [Tilletia horrida]KAK0536555.1 Cytochrome c oxidase assembly protein cox11, mitochondrial [Tilletia horrida]